MKPEDRKLVIDALRSGDYTQTRRVLHNGECFCVMGVIADVLLDTYWVLDDEDLWSIRDPDNPGNPDRHTLWTSNRNKIGISDEDQETLIDWNDKKKMTFDEIADRIEEGEVLS